MNKRHARLRHRLSVLSGSVDRRQKVALVSPALLTPQLGEGLAQCAYEVADTKVIQVVDFARQHRNPLHCTLERISQER